MAYRVNITPRAERDLARIYSYINGEDSVAAFGWYQGLKEAILALEISPGIRGGIPESSTLRHLLYGRKPHIYRVIYRIVKRENRVDVLPIRHGVRQKAPPANLR